MKILKQEGSGPQSQRQQKATSIDHKLEECCSAGGAVLAAEPLWVTVSSAWFRSGRCDDHVCEMYYKWLKTFANQSAQLNYGPPTLANHKGEHSIRFDAWFDRYLMSSHEHDRWMNTFHMRRATFLWICSQLELDAWKKDSKVRPKIPLASQLGGTLYFLMRGADHRDVAEKFGIEVSSVQSTIQKCVASIVEVLGGYLKWPRGDAMGKVSREFLLKWSLPNCQGSLGVTRIDVLSCKGKQSKGDEGNSAGGDSIALLGVCDTVGAFLNVYCAYPGTLPNSTVLQSSGLYHRAMGGDILSEPSSRVESGYLVRPYLLADASYKPSPWLFCPESWSPNQQLTAIRNPLIHRYVQGRSCVELAFAEIRRVFKSLSSGIHCSIPTAPTFVHACCILHNILLLRNDIHVKQPSEFSSEPLECGEFQCSEDESVSQTDVSFDDLELEGDTEQDSDLTSEADNMDLF